jgi:hypothetical protein
MSPLNHLSQDISMDAKQIAALPEELPQRGDEGELPEPLEVLVHAEDQYEAGEAKIEEADGEASEEFLAHRDDDTDEEVEPDPRDNDDDPVDPQHMFYPWKNWTRAFMSIWILIYKPPQRMLNSLLMVSSVLLILIFVSGYLFFFVSAAQRCKI